MPAADEAAARQAIDDLWHRFHDARHVCTAWRLGAPPPAREARHDDGEPSGTGGKPLLAAIRRADLTNTVVAVVRYYGGIKLGTGPLARAYGTAAALALDAAPKQELRLGRRFRLEFPYAARRILEHLLRARGGRVDRESYGALVGWEVWLPHSACADFATVVIELTAGAATAVEVPTD